MGYFIIYDSCISAAVCAVSLEKGKWQPDGKVYAKV